MSDAWRPRILILPLAASIIAGLVAWKLSREPTSAVIDTGPLLKRRAPTFELYDQNSRLVNLERYMHRHRIVVVFFDGNIGAANDDTLRLLRDNYDAIENSETVAVGVSTALPQVNERAGQFPFPLLTDMNPLVPGSEGMVHRVWGCYDEVAGTTRPAVFVIDRTGLVEWDSDGPKPAEQPLAAIQKIIDGE